MPKQYNTPFERIEGKYTIDPNTGCWEWNGLKDKDGYGKIKVEQKSLRAHRYSFTIHKGAITDGLHILHSCDNPCCINPDHLSVGTNTDNVNDKLNRNRQPVGVANGAAKLTPSDVKNIRASKDKILTIAEKYKISKSTVHRIRNKTTWKHI